MKAGQIVTQRRRCSQVEVGRQPRVTRVGMAFQPGGEREFPRRRLSVGVQVFGPLAEARQAGPERRRPTHHAYFARAGGLQRTSVRRNFMILDERGLETGARAPFAAG